MEVHIIDFTSIATNFQGNPAHKSARTKAANSDLQFIDSAASFMNKDIRQQQISQVRSHVMRQSRRKQSEAKRKRLREAAIATLTQDSSHCWNSTIPLTARSILLEINKSLNTNHYQFTEKPVEYRMESRNTTPILFNRLHIELTSDINQNGTELYQTKSVSPRPLWFITAVTNPALLSATLIVTSNQYNNPHRMTGEMVSSRSDAISKISQSISKSNVSPSNETMATVTTLAVYEVSCFACITLSNSTDANYTVFGWRRGTVSPTSARAGTNDKASWPKLDGWFRSCDFAVAILVCLMATLSVAC
jgi:hypothetical protein